MDINKKDRVTLKSYFRKNLIPTESNFADLIDGMLNQKDDGIAKLPGDPLSIGAAGEASGPQKLINFYGNLADPNPAWTLQLNPRADQGNPASNKVGFSIGDGQGASRLFIDSATGNIGIATIKPEAKLHVQGDIKMVGSLSILAPDQNYLGLTLTRTDEQQRLHQWAFWHMNEQYGRNSLQLWEYKADSQGRTCGGDLKDGAICAARLTIREGGNVGIGIDKPGAKLDIYATDGAWGGWYEAIRLSRAEHSAITHPGSGLMFGMHSNRRFYFYDTVEGQHIMVLDANPGSGGNVGIGIDTPGAKLHVVGDTKFVGNQLIAAPDQNIYGLSLDRIDENQRQHRWTFWHMNKGYGQNSLQIWEYKADSKGNTCGGDGKDGAMCDARLTIREGGNVGIGIVTPDARLHVNGDTVIGGALTVQGSRVYPKIKVFRDLEIVNGGVDSAGKMEVSYAGQFTEVYDCFVMFQGHTLASLWAGGHWISADSIPQVVYVKVTEFNKTRAVVAAYCSESKREYEADNRVMFTLVVMGY